jgi:hypothetical protein
MSATRKFPTPAIPISVNGESPGIHSTSSEVIGLSTLWVDDHKGLIHKVLIIDVWGMMGSS